MQTMLNVHEAKANFSSILTEVKNKLMVMLCSSALPGIHKAPAVRFIIATTLLNDCVVVTGAHLFPEYGVETIV